MLKKNNLLSTGAGLLLLTASTAAWSDFSGGYVGGSAGLFTSATLDTSLDADLSLGIEDMLTKFDLLAGLGTQADQIYFGFEGQYTLINNLDDSVFNDAEESLSLEAQEGWALSARLGYVPANNILLYGKAGIGERNYELSVPGASEDEDFSGPGFGVGIEYMATDRVSIRLEGMRYDYSSEGADGIDFDPVEQTVDLIAVARF